MADSDNVRVAVTGAVRTGPLGTTAPVDSTTTWGVGWVDLGYISEDGVTETPNAEWAEIRAWQNRAVVRRSLTSSDITWSFTVIETTADVLELYHPGATLTTTTGKSKLEIGAPSTVERAFGFDIIDGDTHQRIVVPKAEITERGELVYNGQDPIGYQLTIAARESALVDAQGNKVYAIKFSDDPAWDAAA